MIFLQVMIHKRAFFRHKKGLPGVFGEPFMFVL